MRITQFTDPMCTWCWGSEPVVRHLRAVYGERLDVEYVMGGLVEDFETFSDPANDVSEPGDVAPHWLEASEVHGMPVDVSVFDENPARSTYPASVAFVAARQQAPDRAHRYLRRLREAYVTRARNVNERDEQLALAAAVGLDVDAFAAALDDGSAREGFEADLSRTREAGVTTFPTYRVEGPDGSRRASGFRSFDDLVEAISAVAPALERSSPPPIRRFLVEYGPVATQEVAETYDLDRGKARQVLRSLAGEGAAFGEERATGWFWYATGGDD